MDEKIEASVFVASLEARAKRILKEADKKRREELRMEHQKLYVRSKSSGTSKKVEQTGSILIPKVDSSTASSSGKLIALDPSVSTMMLSTEAQNRMTKTQAMHYSVPKLTVSLNADTVDLNELAMSGKIRPDISGPGMKTLDPILRPKSGKTLRLSGTKSASFDTSFLTKSLDAPKKTVNRTLERLDQSPFISGSATNLDEFIATGKKTEKKSGKIV
jgi:hypothetical protein